MKRYLKVYLLAMKNSLMGDLEYKADYFVTLIHLIIYVFFNVAFYRVILNNVNTIEGWNYPQLVVLIGTFMIIDSIFMCFMLGNFGDFDAYVRLGELDRFLVKPMDGQFLATTQITRFNELISGFIGFGVVFYGFYLLNFIPNILQILAYFFFLACSSVLVYSFSLMIACLVFLFERIDSIHEVIISFVQFSKMPDVYRGPIKIAFMLFVPVVFASFVPVGLLFGKVSLSFIFYYLVITALFLTASRFIWKTLLKRYKSAGG